MTKLHIKATFVLYTLLILIALASETLGCARRSDVSSKKNEVHKPKYNYRYQFGDPKYNEFIASNRKHRTIVPADKPLIPDYELTVAQSSCGETLCVNIPDYPLDEINRVIDRARNILRPGNTIVAFQRKGISFGNFTSKYDSFWYGERAPDHRFVDDNIDCQEHVSTIYPQEAYSYQDQKAYYVVNVPTMYRGLTRMLCESDNQMCITGNSLSEASGSCRQMYREEQLLVLPTDKYDYYFDLEDFELKTFYVPTGCACVVSP